MHFIFNSQFYRFLYYTINFHRPIPFFFCQLKNENFLSNIGRYLTDKLTLNLSRDSKLDTTQLLELRQITMLTQEANYTLRCLFFLEILKMPHERGKLKKMSYEQMLSFDIVILFKREGFCKKPGYHAQSSLFDYYDFDNSMYLFRNTTKERIL